MRETSIDAPVTGQEERVLSATQVMCLRFANEEQARLLERSAGLRKQVEALEGQAAAVMNQAVMAIRGDIQVPVVIPIQFADVDKNVVVRWTPPAPATEGEVVGSIAPAAAATEAAPTA